jgi:LPXTG-site transpeptidase (sortase) family protein
MAKKQRSKTMSTRYTFDVNRSKKGLSKKLYDFKRWYKRTKEMINSDKRLRIVSKIVLILMFFLGLYLVIYPFFPAIMYKLFQEGDETYPYVTKLESIISDGGQEFSSEEIPEDNRIVIPSISVDMPIVEGLNESVLKLGIWHRPQTGTPGNGNMVLTGHRVGYAFLPEDVKNSTSFYHLDKLEEGQYVIIYWEGVEYDYEVYKTEIVERNELSIEKQDGTERLTLYTCHPIGERSHRLVVYAKRIEI